MPFYFCWNPEGPAGAAAAALRAALRGWERGRARRLVPVALLLCPVPSLAAGTGTGSVPSLEQGLSAGSAGFTAGEQEAALEAELVFKKVYLHFR